MVVIIIGDYHEFIIESPLSIPTTSGALQMFDNLIKLQIEKKKDFRKHFEFIFHRI